MFEIFGSVVYPRR